MHPERTLQGSGQTSSASGAQALLLGGGGGGGGSSQQMNGNLQQHGKLALSAVKVEPQLLGHSLQQQQQQQQLLIPKMEVKSEIDQEVSSFVAFFSSLKNWCDLSDFQMKNIGPEL